MMWDLPHPQGSAADAFYPRPAGARDITPNESSWRWASSRRPHRLTQPSQGVLDRRLRHPQSDGDLPDRQTRLIQPPDLLESFIVHRLPADLHTGFMQQAQHRSLAQTEPFLQFQRGRTCLIFGYQCFEYRRITAHVDPMDASDLGILVPRNQLGIENPGSQGTSDGRRGDESVALTRSRRFEVVATWNSVPAPPLSQASTGLFQCPWADPLPRYSCSDRARTCGRGGSIAVQWLGNRADQLIRAWPYPRLVQSLHTRLPRGPSGA
jgi:hypothetical protein